MQVHGMKSLNLPMRCDVHNIAALLTFSFQHVTRLVIHPTVQSVKRKTALYSKNAAAIDHLGIQTGQSELIRRQEHVKKDKSVRISSLYYF